MTATAAQLRKECGVRPAHFAPITKRAANASQGERFEAHRARKEQSAKTLNALCVRAERLTPNDALHLAQRLLVAVLDDGVSYADFQSAQAVERYVRKAANALSGLSLS